MFFFSFEFSKKVLREKRKKTKRKEKNLNCFFPFIQKTKKTFNRQTLALWRAIAHDMFRLWVLAQEDLFGASSGGRYRLTDTGQGLQRVRRKEVFFF